MEIFSVYGGISLSIRAVCKKTEYILGDHIDAFVTAGGACDALKCCLCRQPTSFWNMYMLHAYICFFIGKKETCQGYSIIFLSDTKAVWVLHIYFIVVVNVTVFVTVKYLHAAFLKRSSFSICVSFNTCSLCVADPHGPVRLSVTSLSKPFSVRPSFHQWRFVPALFSLSFLLLFFLFMFVSFSRLFCSSCLEALSHPVAGVLPFPLGRPPRPSLWPLNISTSQVGAGASSPCFSSLESCSALSLSLHSFILIPSIMHLCFFVFIVLMVDFVFLLCWDYHK